VSARQDGKPTDHDLAASAACALIGRAMLEFSSQLSQADVQRSFARDMRQDEHALAIDMGQVLRSLVIAAGVVASKLGIKPEAFSAQARAAIVHFRHHVDDADLLLKEATIYVAQSSADRRRREGAS
jgi:hypothetical protein